MNGERAESESWKMKKRRIKMRGNENLPRLMLCHLHICIVQRKTLHEFDFLMMIWT
jgi:hypothetical protein